MKTTACSYDVVRSQSRSVVRLMLHLVNSGRKLAYILGQTLDVILRSAGCKDIIHEWQRTIACEEASILWGASGVPRVQSNVASRVARQGALLSHEHTL